MILCWWLWVICVYDYMCEVDLCMMNVIEDFVCMNWEMNWFPECILIIMLHARWILLWTYTIAQSLSSILTKFETMTKTYLQVKCNDLSMVTPSVNLIILHTLCWHSWFILTYMSILPEDAAHQGSCPEVVYVRATLSFGSADWSTVLYIVKYFTCEIYTIHVMDNMTTIGHFENLALRQVLCMHLSDINLDELDNFRP